MQESLAIVGMACRLPGGDGLEAFWDLVLQGQTAWGPLPEARLSRELYYDREKSKIGKSYSELGGIISDRPVDRALCPITPEMFEKYDIAHQIFLEVASLACRDAGMDPFAMPANRRTGVYVGHTGGSTKIGDVVYSTGIDQAAHLLCDMETAHTLLGSDAECVAAEVTAAIRSQYPGRTPGKAYDLGSLAVAKIVQEALRLDGPYLVVDAACASSLQAMAIGARALLQGGIDQAIVGGASYCKSDSLVLFSAAQSVSNAGSCPFGKSADGLVTAEGYVALVMKTLSRAIADGDRIRAVIQGIGVASDGKGKSLWAPRQEGQTLAVERAYANPDDISRLDYIEAHATSTQVGDATELAALSSLIGEHLPPGKQIPIGSVKAHIGHTLETAGMASLVKVVLAMEHGIIPPGSTCDELNPEFDWKHGPFFVPREAMAWPSPAIGPRTAAVNAFGIGGLNVHVSLAEYAPHQEHRDSSKPAMPGSQDPDANAIAIVGMGAVLPGGLTLQDFYDLLDRGESAIGPVPADRWNLSRALDSSSPRAWHTVGGIGGFVQGFAYDWRRHKVPPKQIAAANPLQFMLLDAADAAIAEACGSDGKIDLNRTRTGVVVGTMFGGEFSNDLQMGLRLPETVQHLRAAFERRHIPTSSIDRMIQDYEKKVLAEFPALVDETGSFTSSTLASRLTKSFDLMGGALALDAGDCSSLSAISVAVDILRQGECDAVVCAAGQRHLDLDAFEGFSIAGDLATTPQSMLNTRQAGRVPGEGAVVLVLKRLPEARAAGNRIRGVIRGVALGSGRTLAQAASRVIREATDHAGLKPSSIKLLEVCGCGKLAGDAIALNALASQYGGSLPVESAAIGSLECVIGHVGAAAGAAAIVKIVRSLEEGISPGTLGLKEDASVSSGLRVSARAYAVPAMDAAGYRAGAVTVMHGELVGHMILDNAAPMPTAIAPLVAPVASQSSRPLVAAIFPGQGSQYTDMFRGLVEDSPEAKTCLRNLDAMAQASGLQTLAEIAWQPVNGLGTTVWDTQWAMYLADLLAWGVLQKMGFAPDVIASHSFGEFPSLTAAGAWSIQDGAKATRARADAVEQFGPRNGAMLSIIADSQAVASAIEPFAGQVWVCAQNAPEQSVVGGIARAVDAVELLLETRNVKSKRLAVPSPFHTPLLKSAGEELSQTIATLAIHQPRIATFSSTTAQRLESSGDIRESLIRQMTDTVRWVSVVERLYESGVRTFVEVGPSGVLSGLTRRILEGKKNVTIIQFDQRSRAATEHLEKVRGQLAAAGALRTHLSSPVAATENANRAGSAAGTGGGTGMVIAYDATSRRRARNRSQAASTRTAKPRQHVAAGVPHGIESQRGVDEKSYGSSDEYRTLTKESTGNGSQHSTQDQSPAGRPAKSVPEYLEDVVAHLLEEFGLELPLSADRATPDTETFFLTAADMFDLQDADRAAVVSARSLENLCDIFAQSGGKADWLTRRAGPQPAATSHEPINHPAQNNAVAGGVPALELETFLIDFVVEQTGYPREIVEMDADLEADLGIDSIRKAQLFGEIGQKYGLSVDDSVSLDDFRTLRHLLAYMLPKVGGAQARPAGVQVPAVDSRSAHSSGHGENGHLKNGLGSTRYAANGQSHFQDDTTQSPNARTFAGSNVAEELETFLIDFVVEQTGYPREIVEMDADLEADLGIDSIRKAQLFGEIGQKYGLSVDDSVSLDDFHTLRHLLAYMLPKVGIVEGDASPKKQESLHRDAMADSSAFQNSEAFCLGVEIGQTHGQAIRLWARQVAGKGRHAGGAHATFGDQLAGVAHAAGVDHKILQIALENPSAALGGFDTLIVAGDGPVGMRGIAVGFGRHADPSVESFDESGLKGTLIGIKGLPGGIVGWNSAGLLIVAGEPRADRPAVSSGMDAVPVTSAIEQLVRTCQSIQDVERILKGYSLPVPSLLVLNAWVGGMYEVRPDGSMNRASGVRQSGDARAALARIACADSSVGPADALATLIDPARESNVRDAMSAACTWLAVGVDRGQAMAASGGPLPMGAWLTGDIALLGENCSSHNPRTAAANELAFSPSAQSTPSVTCRYSIAMRQAQAIGPCRSLSGETVLILGVGPISSQLADAVRLEGARATIVACGSQQEAFAAVEKAEAAGPVRHLVVAAAWLANDVDWPANRQATIIAPYFACQRWISLRAKAGDLGESTLTAVTHLGGDFGISGRIECVESGAMTGLLKGIAREFSSLHVRIVDCDANTPLNFVTKHIVAEMRDGSGPVEVGFVDGRRQTTVPCKTVAQSFAKPQPPRATPVANGSQRPLSRGSVWLFTGGARGVTAACALELAKRHGVRLALVGSTRPVDLEKAWLSLDEAGLRELKGSVMLAARGRNTDPRNAWKTIEKSLEIAKSLARFSAAGVEADYFPCDMSQPAEVALLVQQVAKELGPVRGIVHGAGFESACRFEKKTLQGLEATLGPKCIGLENLLRMIDTKSLEYLVAFGSTSGRMGGVGQADYSMANDMLAKIVCKARGEKKGFKATVFHWHAWDEVGMASRPESRFVLEQFGLKFMPLAEGVGRFMDEIEAGLPDVEVLVTESVLCPDAVSGPLPSAISATDAVGVEAVMNRLQVGSLVGAVEKKGDATWVSFHLNPTSDCFLREHTQHGRPLLPAVMGAELLAQAAIAAGACQQVQEIRDFVVERAVGFSSDQGRQLRVEVSAAQDGLVRVQGWSRMRSATIAVESDERVHLSGVVAGELEEPILSSLDSMPFPFNPMVYQNDAPLKHGPAYRTLSGLLLDRDGGWGRLVATDPEVLAHPRGAAGWTLPIALLDGCLVGCAVYSYILLGKRVEVPLRFERLRIVSQPSIGEKCTLRLFYCSHDHSESIYNFVLYGADGRAILAVDKLHLAVTSDRSR